MISGWFDGTFGDSLKNMFRMTGLKIGDQFGVDRQVRRQHDEMPDVFLQIEIPSQGERERANVAALAAGLTARRLDFDVGQCAKL